ncbi:hypothetical protein RYX41_09310 [Lactiplantibacillus plantarum]|nr:hypothetical protein [Lactiplantibacillus plantarum]
MPRPKRRVGLWTYIISIVVVLGIGVGGTYWLIGRQVNAQLSSMQQTSKAMKRSNQFMKRSMRITTNRSMRISWPTVPLTAWSIR